MEEFDEIASSLEGFTLDHRITLEVNGQRTYRNHSRNLFINWSIPSGRRICIGAIQEKPVSDLAIVTGEIVPYAISIFNKLSPTKKIQQNIVDQSIREAQQADLIIPKYRN